MASPLRRSAFTLVAALLPAALSAAPANSTITAVTVYLDRAVVTRSAALDLPAGDQEVTFEQLPNELDSDSLHVAGSGSVHAVLGDVTANVVFPDKAPDERVRALQDQLRGEEKQLRALNDQATALEKQRALATRMADAAAQGPTGKDGTAPARLAPAEMQQLLDFYGTVLVKLSEGAAALDAERDPLKEKIAATTAQLDQLAQRQYKSTKTVVVRVALAEAGKLELTLTYALTGAQWRPTYEARVSGADHHLDLGYFGIVTQRTGEDWKGVVLTLSTARPAVGGNVPELSPWYVDEMEPANLLRKAKGMALAREAPALEAGANVGRPYVATFGVETKDAAVQEGATSATFRIPGTVDVPSDNSPRKETVARIPLNADLSYVATPKLLPAAFLSAAVTNSSDYPLLAGPMAVFLDETFVANARVKTVMPNEKFDLALGVDDGIAVERKVLNRFTEDLGIITKKSRVNYDILIKVTNHRKEAVKLVLEDQLPVSRQEKIEVAQAEPSPDKVKPDEQGLLKWTLDLAPGEKQEIPLKFSVTYPNDIRISGIE